MLPPPKVTPAARAAGLMPSTRASRYNNQSRSSTLEGARLNPQLPVTTVVTPCHDAGEAVGSNISWAS